MRLWWDKGGLSSQGTSLESDDNPLRASSPPGNFPAALGTLLSLSQCLAHHCHVTGTALMTATLCLLMGRGNLTPAAVLAPYKAGPM